MTTFTECLEASPSKAPWFQGSVEEAFALAKKESKPLFLYWGAVWCPPCNYLKAQVFDHPGFPALMRPSIAVWLDGDSERAQEWGAKLKAEGYPTIIIFDPGGTERLRLSASMTLGEFEKVVSAAFTEPSSLRELMARALLGKAAPKDMELIAGTDWSQISDATYLETDHVNERLRLFEKIDKKEKGSTSVRARLAASILMSGLTTSSDDGKKDIASTVKGTAAELLAAIFHDESSVYSAREMVAYFQQEYMSWLFPEPNAARALLVKTWSNAHETLRKIAGEKDTPVSPDILMGLAMGDVTLYRLSQVDSKKELPLELKTAVKQAVANADKMAVSEHQRIAIIPNAAYYLREVGDFEGARALLEKELKSTRVPWYFQSSFSSLERAAGNNEKALHWASEARRSAQGRASRIQWIASEIMLVANIKPADHDQRLEQLVTEYFDTALALPDGFAGRNSRRMDAVTKILKPLQDKKAFAELTKNYAKKCQDHPRKDGCASVFANISAGT